MEPLILVANPGSSSREYALYRSGKRLIGGYYEHVHHGVQVTFNGSVEKNEDLHDFDYAASLDHFMDGAAAELSIERGDVEAVGLRLVAPGRRFLQHQQLDDELYAYLSDNVDKAPLHISVELQQIDQIKDALPDLPIYLVSDSAFHHSLTHEARNYAINKDDADAFDIYRFGYHGISIKSVVHTLRETMNVDYPRMIVCHLGSGVSITAIRDWRSVETSMGYSPLEGLVMATRSGSIDIKAALELKKQKQLTDEELIDYLNHESGLKGLSGTSSDIRQLLEFEANGDKSAKFALGAMVYRISSYIGAYHAVLGGLDALVFTATVGERSAVIRRRICESIAHLGIELDTFINDAVDSSRALISKQSSPVNIHVIPTDETGEIARQTAHMIAHR